MNFRSTACPLHLTGKLLTFASILTSAGMLQDSRNDTLLKQLHQAVDTHFSDSIQLARQLVMPSDDLHVPPLKAKDSINREFFPVLQKQVSLKRLISGDDAELVLIPPIQAEKVVLLTEEPIKPRLILPERKIERNSPDWEMGVFILAFILLGSVRLFFNKYLGQLLISTINYITASRMFRERSLSFMHASFRLDVMFYMVSSLFVFHALQVFHIRLYRGGIISYLFILGGLVAYFALKRFAYYLQGNISRTVQETLEFLFNMNTYNRVLGLFLLPVSLIVAFTPMAEPELVVLAGISVICIFYLLLILRGVKILMRKHFSIFYLILYLCTLEILPLLFIYKLVLG